MSWPGAARLTAEDKLSRAEGRRVFRRSVAMLRPQKRLTLLAIFVMFLFALSVLAGPQIFAYGINNGIEKGKIGPVNAAAIAYLVVATLGVFLERGQVRLVTRVGERFLRDLRVRVFDHIQAMSMSFFDNEKTGRLVSRMTADINALEDLVQQGLIVFVTNFILIIVAVVVLLIYSPIMFAICLVTMPVLLLASRRFKRDSDKAYLDVRDRISQTLSTLQEGISGIRVIQAFGREDSQMRRFSAHNRAQLDANIKSARIAARYFPVVEFCGVATVAALVGLGGVLVHSNLVAIGTVVAFVLYVNKLYDPIQQMSQLFQLVQQSAAALHKLFGLLDTHSEITEHHSAVDLPLGGDIEISGVGFAYQGEEGSRGPMVLRDVSLTIHRGEHLALVGPTGAGKSTLAKLIARMYDPVEGSITYAGVDLRRATLSSLRRRMVVVPQEGFLFSGSILDNVALGKEGATEAEVLEALSVIGSRERFERLPDGLRTEVRERGSRLSGGERQLVSLARAALANPEVLVLDEATSSLDPGTEADVEAAMTALMRGRTVIIIAHRLSTAERADRVAVVDAGGLVEEGSHEELMARSGRYAALFASWSGSRSAVA